MLSSRTAWRLDPNRLHQLGEARRAQGTGCDLTVSNPTRCGFRYPASLTVALADPEVLDYDPQPLGAAAARAAVEAYYRERGVALAQERLALTASTSEAYSHLFRLLCDAGDAVLMPSPSYPLFEMLAGLADVRLCPATMVYDQGWQLDLPALAAAGPDVRAVLLVHPNNPAGNYIKPKEWDAVQALAAARDWAVVVDEVFFDYAMPPFAPVALDVADAPALTFVLNGLSKLSALPQMKLAWIAAFGPERLLRPAWARLEVILDLHLSVSAPVQRAAAVLLEARHTMQPQIRERLRDNLAWLDDALARQPALERLVIEGGWNVLLRLPRLHTDAAWAERLVEGAGVLTHPGHFYGLEQESCLALSLLPPAADFRRGVERMLEAIAGEIG
ncbi:MAG: pyridoxal phosphate-dependent aminotransferase [Terriglobales bacterium]